jgi:hypothetical protein
VAARGTIEVKYKRGREEKTETQEFQTIVYSRNAIDWNDGTACVASFINPNDPVIRDFVSRLLSTQSDDSSMGYIFSNIRAAIRVYNGVCDYGMQYLADPSSPYHQIKDQASGLDNIQFPVELLNSKTGDCDDLTVLFCNLLESAGIETAVVDVPGHLFMMFNTGVPWAYRMAFQVDESMLIKHRGQVYVPVELTELKSSFWRAWQSGAEQVHRWENLSSLTIIDIGESWKLHPPVPVRIPLQISPVYSSSLDSLVTQDFGYIQTAQKDYMNTQYQGSIASLSKDPAVLNRAAISQIFAGNLKEGEDLLRRAMDLEPAQIQTLVNLANCLTLQDRWEEATAIYDQIDDSKMTETIALNELLAVAMQGVSAGETQETATSEKFWDMVNRYRHANFFSATDADIQKCIAENSNPLEAAECTRDLLGQTGATTGERKGQSTNTIESNHERKVRIFQWLY